MLLHFLLLLVIILVKLTHKINHHNDVFSKGKIFLLGEVSLIEKWQSSLRNGSGKGGVTVAGGGVDAGEHGGSRGLGKKKKELGLVK